MNDTRFSIEQEYDQDQTINTVYTVSGIKFRLGSFACPEAYDIIKNDEVVGYLKVRNSNLRVYRTQVMTDLLGWQPIYEETFPSDIPLGGFPSEAVRQNMLALVADIFNEKQHG